MSDIKLDELSLDELIMVFENKVNEISEKFDEIKNKTQIVDGGESWRSKSQEAFKEKKNMYTSQFEIIIEEYRKQIEQLRFAKQSFSATEQAIEQGAIDSISDINIM